MRRLLFLVCSVVFASGAPCSTLLVLQFHNNSQYSDLNWVGEGVAETLRAELSGASQIVLDRDARADGLRQLSLKPDADYTKATIIRLGQSLDVDLICYGSYDINLASPNTELKDSSVRISARFLDLRKMHEGPEMSEAGKLSDLTRLEEHLAWQTLKYVDPSTNIPLDQFMSPAKLVRLDAEESYVRGLMSTNPEQQEKWFLQASKLDPQFSGAAFELGKVELREKNYRQAITWFEHIPATDIDYGAARFKMGLAAFRQGDYKAASNYFREVSKQFPLSEVYNDLGAAENELNDAAAIDDFRRALEGNQSDPTYLFNLGVALLKNNQFDEAAKQLQLLRNREPDDPEAQALLNRAMRQEFTPVSAKSPAAERLKESFNETAYRQLKAVLMHPSN